MEKKQMKCVLQLPLEEIALRRVVIMLWNQAEVLAEIKPGNFGFGFRRMKPLAKALESGFQLVRSRLSEGMLPESLLNKVTDLIKPVGSEIILWQSFHTHFFHYPHMYFEKSILGYSDPNLDATVLMKLRWTSVGTVDYQKTAEELIRLEMLDVVLLFKLACFYCLEDCVSVLWERLPEKFKERFCNDADVQVGLSKLDSFWARILIDDGVLGNEQYRPSQNAMDFYRCAFEKAALTGNKAAAQHFHRKFTNNEIEVLLLRTAKVLASEVISVGRSPNVLPNQKYSDVLCYLLSQMSPEQRMELLKAHPCRVLCWFLKWPCQDLFMDLVEMTCHFLSTSDYCYILQIFAISACILGNISVNLFRNFFVHSPDSFKNFLLEQSPPSSILVPLLISENSEIFRCVFESIDVAAIVTFLFNKQGYQVCSHLVQTDNWHFVKLLIRKAMLSEEQKKRLKETWESEFSRDYGSAYLSRKSQEWERVFESSDGCASGKRSLEDLKMGEAKKLRIHE